MTAQNPTLKPGASELMRSLGLDVDGPAQWGKPVFSRAPGVFVVELPGGRADAPIDTVALRRWLERVPELRLDGEAATPQELGRRLAEAWLPSEAILYVGRSVRAVGQRVAAMYATPLGDARPYAGGYWLKALSALSELRVWWAETDAHEEFEDALMTAVTERSGVPFANAGRPGAAEKHGLTGALREVAAGAPATGKGGRAKGPKPRATSTRPRAPRDAPRRPTREPTFLSPEGLERLTAELAELRTNVRPGVIARVKAARELGDLKENADYEYARKEQSFVEGRILTLEQMLKTSVVIDTSAAPSDSARLGSTVVIEADGDEVTYVIVGSTEADPRSGRISNASPVGKALLGARSGDQVIVQLPNGTMTYRVREVR